jgi:Zn-dependent M16 (insulinase) family peptidase
MQISNGFELLREQALIEFNSTARLYRHTKTSAELLSLVNDDENKVFGVTFRTPPRDSTGVAHILEHAVLCGSRKYAVKEPFVELMKGSLNTFLNAMTFSDKTCYPVASQNLRDFYNLIDVYLDAVFYPLITPNAFQQEGWHYELDAVDAPLLYKGVVFNEMKGSYSSPDDRLNEFSQRSLFPDTVYGLDSGGDPRHIPDLTYANFKAFHQRYYHPSNARLFFSGDDDPDERLRLLDSWLRAFDSIAVDSMVALQKRFSAPRRLSRTFVAGAGKSDRRAMATVNWMIDQIPDTETDLGVGILEHILIGTPASPLRKALVDSGWARILRGAVSTTSFAIATDVLTRLSCLAGISAAWRCLKRSAALRHASIGCFLEIDIGERLPIEVTDDEARLGFFGGPGRREAPGRFRHEIRQAASPTPFAPILFHFTAHCRRGWILDLQPIVNPARAVGRAEPL